VLDQFGRHDEATRNWERALELDDGSLRARIVVRLQVSRLRAGLQHDHAWPLLWCWPRH
jgi:hypothetical protein